MELPMSRIQGNEVVIDNVNARQPVSSRSGSESDTADACLVVYGIEDNPPWYICVILGLQHYLMNFSACLIIPLMLMPKMCVGDNHMATIEVFCTLVFISGICTFLQSAIGTRLPIIQGISPAHLLPALSILALPEFRCPTTVRSGDNFTSTPSESMNATIADQDMWKIRMREIQGALIASSLFQVVIGATGLAGYIIKGIGPLTVAPTLALIGLSLFQMTIDNCASQWYIAILTMFLITLFSQYMRNIRIPCGILMRDDKVRRIGGFPLFEMFSVILAIIVVWIISFILTVKDVFPNDETKWGYQARTDVRSYVLYHSAWFKFPFPFQWGLPTFSAGGVFGMLAGVLAGMVESIGDYYACARLSGAPPPPAHAINRGVFAEGIGNALSGVWGTATGLTSHSDNIASIGLTKVASRRVIYYSVMFMVLTGLVQKFGALFVTIPDPVMGGVFMVVLGLVVSVGISNLQFVNLNSSRNIYIFGFSFFFGFSLPIWMGNNGDVIQTGSTTIDRILTVLLSTQMFVGGIIGFLLDNTIPGTPEERGMSRWLEGQKECNLDDRRLKCYALPFGMKSIRQMAWTSYIPMCPTFVPSKQRAKCCKKPKCLATEPQSLIVTSRM